MANKVIIEELVTKLTTDGAELKKGMDDSLNNAKSWAGNMTKIAASISFAGFAGAAAAGTVLTSLTKSAIDNADAISKQSQIVGVATEEWSAYLYAADMSGVTNEQLEAGFRKLSQSAVDAFRGVGSGSKVFDELGISVKDADGNLKNNSQLLLDLADRFAALPDGANKSSLAMDVFGKSGATLIPMLNGGSEGLKIFKEEAERLNLVIDTDTGKAAEQFNDNLSRMGKGLDGIGNVLAEKALPSLVKLTNIIVDPNTATAAGNFADWIIDIGDAALEAAGNAMPFVKAYSLLKSVVGDVEFDVDWFDKDEIDAQEKALGRLIDRAKMLYGEDFKADDRFKYDPISDEIAQQTIRLERLKKLREMENKSTSAGSNGGGKGNPTVENPLLKNWEIEQQREIAIMLDKEKRAQEVADREVAIQRDKFARIHEEMLVAEDNVVSLEQFRYERAQKELQDEMDYLNEKGLLSAELELEFQMAKEEQEMAHQERLKNIKEQARQEDLQKQIAQLQGYEQLFGSMGDIFDSFGARQSKARRLLLIAEKAAAIKSATISINEGIANSARLGFPQNIAAIGATVAATAGLISNIESVGVAHGGLTNVPKEQTYFLDKGERVVSPKQNRDLTQFLDSSRAGGGLKIELINTSGVPMEASTEQDGDTLRVILTAVDNKLRTDLNAGRGVWREAKERFGWSVRGAF